MNKAGALTVLVGPIEISGYYASLITGLNQCGCKAVYGMMYTHPFGYGSEHPSGPLRMLILNVWNWSERNRRRRSLWLAARLLHKLLSATYFLLWLPSIDAAIMGFGHSYWPAKLDLLCLRLLGKKVIVNLGHGSDMRPPYLDGSYLSPDASAMPNSPYLSRRAYAMSRNVQRCTRWAHWVIGQPLSSSYFSRRIMVNWFAIGWPRQVSYVDCGEPVSFARKKRPWRLLHAPSNPALKGTVLIRDAIAKLRSDGYAIHYIELQGKSNNEVLELLKWCDLVVDQVYSDTPMAGLALEAAAYGKPALVAGYGFNQLRQHVAPGCWPPSFTCLPSELVATLESIIKDPFRSLCKGREAQHFIEQHWCSALVAQRYLRLITSDAPSDWLFDPNSVHYLYGCGLSDDRVNETVAGLIATVGLEGLQLGHRLDLQRDYQEVAQSLG